MSTLSKVFVVVNLLLGFCFLMASLTLYAKKVEFVTNLDKSVDERNSLDKRLAAVTLDRDKLYKESKATIALQKTNIEKLLTSNSSLQRENAGRKRDNEEIKGSISKIESNIKLLQVELVKKEDRNKELVGIAKKARSERNAAAKAQAYSEKQTIEINAELQQALNTQRDLAKQNHTLVQKNMTQSVLIQRAQEQGVNFDTVVATPPIPIAGLVKAVDNEAQIVILSVGEKSQVQKGMNFIISRGSAYVGTVRVYNVWDDVASALFVPGLMKGLPKVSDHVQHKTD